MFVLVVINLSFTISVGILSAKLEKGVPNGYN